MTIFDYLNANPWVIVGVFVLVLIIIFFIFRQGRELSIKDWLKIGPKPIDDVFKADKNDKPHKEMVSRINQIVDENQPEGFTKKLKQIRSSLPDQSISTLALRRVIRHSLFQIMISMHGPFMGMSYPGRLLVKEFSLEQLIESLPKLIDANNPQKLETSIQDFYKITEPNMYGLTIPDDEFMMAMQMGIFIITRLDKLIKMIENKREITHQILQEYTDEDLKQF